MGNVVLLCVGLPQFYKYRIPKQSLLSEVWLNFLLVLYYQQSNIALSVCLHWNTNKIGSWFVYFPSNCWFLYVTYIETLKKVIIKLLSNIYKFFWFLYLREISFLVIRKKIRFSSPKEALQVSNTFIYCININEYFIHHFPTPFGNSGPEIFNSMTHGYRYFSWRLYLSFYLKLKWQSYLRGSVGWSIVPYIKKVEGLIPSQGAHRRKMINVSCFFLSLSLSLSHSLFLISSLSNQWIYPQVRIKKP